MYIYIIAQDNENNRSVFEQTKIDYPEIETQKRYRENFHIKTDEDVIDPNNPDNNIYYGYKCLLIKDLESDLDTPENQTLLASVENPDIYTTETLDQARQKYYI